MKTPHLRCEELTHRATPAVLVTLSSEAIAPADWEPLGFGIFRTESSDVEGVPGVLQIELDQRVKVEQIPNDVSFDNQYGLNQIQAPAAWDVTKGTGTTIVAVIDSGVDYAHPDLAANIWTNPGEVPGNSIDDDQNGFVDDVHGYDFHDNDADPRDEFGHGTHIAGILGAVGNNTLGVSGVVWTTRIMPLRFLDASGNGSTSDAIRALNYAVANGAKISNHSWGGAIQSESLTTAIERANAKGHILVAAAGNTGRDLDQTPNYPASFSARFSNVVSVAATDYQDRLATFSNHGAFVTLAAPGDSILSTLPRNSTGTKTGTSMATPFVSGALALLWDQHPDWTSDQVIQQLKSTVDVLPSLSEKTSTRGRLNVARLVGGVATVPEIPQTIPGIPPAVVPPAPPPRGFVPTPVAPLPIARRDAIAIATPTPGQATIRIVNLDGTTRENLVLPDDDFRGGVRVASADFSGDGIPEIVVANGPGVSNRVQILDGVTHRVLWDQRPFEPSFQGGLFVAVGDLTSDGIPDVVITPDQGGGPRVRVFDGKAFTVLADFFGIEDPNFRGGARAAVGDINGDGRGDLIVSAGFGGGPRVAGYDGQSLIQHRPTRLFADFFAYESTLRNGVYLAVGDVDGDSLDDLVIGAGPNGGPRVIVLSSRDLIDNRHTLLANFFAGDALQRDGVRVTAKDIDGDGMMDVVVGTTGRSVAYTSKSLRATANPSSGFGFDLPFPELSGLPVFVG